MIHHVAVVRLRDDVSDAQRAQLMAQIDELAAARLAASLAYGLDAGLSSPTNADLALVATFDDAEALRGYLAHPDHVRVVTTLRERAASLSVVQFTDA